MEVHLSKLREMAKAREGWRAAVHGVTGSDTTEQPNNKKKTGAKMVAAGP